MELAESTRRINRTARSENLGANKKTASQTTRQPDTIKKEYKGERNLRTKAINIRNRLPQFNCGSCTCKMMRKNKEWKKSIL